MKAPVKSGTSEAVRGLIPGLVALAVASIVDWLTTVWSAIETTGGNVTLRDLPSGSNVSKAGTVWNAPVSVYKGEGYLQDVSLSASVYKGNAVLTANLQTFGGYGRPKGTTLRLDPITVAALRDTLRIAETFNNSDSPEEFAGHYADKAKVAEIDSADPDVDADRSGGRKRKAKVAEIDSADPDVDADRSGGRKRKR